MIRQALVLLLLATPALAVNPDEQLTDPVLEARAREISRDLRCVVCRNQSIDDSNASVAHDMRLLLRERLVAGDSDEEVLAYFVERFGDFVLLKPPLQPNTYALWIAPFLILASAIGAFALYARRKPEDPAALLPLSEEDRRMLADILEDRQ